MGSQKNRMEQGLSQGLSQGEQQKTFHFPPPVWAAVLPDGITVR